MYLSMLLHMALGHGRRYRSMSCAYTCLAARAARRSMLQFSRAAYLFRVSRPEFFVWVGSFLATLALVTGARPPAVAASRARPPQWIHDVVYLTHSGYTIWWI